MRRWIGFGSILLLSAVALGARAGERPRVQLVPTPDGGIQPQAVVDGRGTTHLVYLKGPEAAADIFYTRRERGATAFSAPVRVNRRPGVAVAVGTIRGAQLAVGKGGRVHVIWFGSDRALATRDADRGAPVMYARQEDGAATFEPERNLMRVSSILDGGPSIAADAAGNVYAAWHASDGVAKGEAQRRIWISRSRDEGRQFAPEAEAFREPTGACACCSARVFADRRGKVHLLYRAATDGTERDMVLLASIDRGATFRGERIHPWRVETCPMSSESFAERNGRLIAAWETRGQVYYARLDPKSGKPGRPIGAPGASESRKHPTVAIDDDGNVLMAWTEGTGWKKGGDLAWQLFDRDDRPTAQHGRRDGAIPVWGLATALFDGNRFTVVH